MKLTQTAMLVLALGATQASATIVNALNLQTGDASELPLVDNAGQPLTQAYVQVGSYAPGKSFGDPTTVLDGFRQLGTSQASLDQAESLASQGLFDGASFAFQEASGTTGDVTAAGGSPIYVVIANNADFSMADMFAVWRSDAVFLADSAGLEGSATAVLATGAGSLEFGNIVNGPTIDFGGGFEQTFTNGIELVGIPEPSTALLSLVGLGFIARRRR